MAAADNDTFEGALVTLITQIGKMKMLNDADLPFVVQLETMVLEKARDPMRKLQSMGLMPQGGGAAPPAPGGMPPGGAPPMPTMPDMGMGGMSAPPPSFMGAGAPPGVMQSPDMPPDQVMPMMA